MPGVREMCASGPEGDVGTNIRAGSSILTKSANIEMFLFSSVTGLRFSSISSLPPLQMTSDV